MKYAIDKQHYHEFSVLELGKLPPRSYFVPFSGREKADAATINNKRYTSDKATCLSGQKRRIICFLGVASCLDLYVNGRFVGYSEGSHNAAEPILLPLRTRHGV